MSHTIEVLFKNQFRLGEGPCWDEVKQRLLFVDIEKSTVHRYNYATSSLDYPLTLPDPYCSAVIRNESGGFVVAAYHRFATLNEQTGLTKTLATVQKDNDQVRFNDGKCDPAGRFWAGMMDLPNATSSSQAGLYTLTAKSTVETKIPNVNLSNGMSWSPDNSTMYYIDTPTYNVVAYRYDISTGAISNPQVFVEFDKWIDGTPDGQCNDANGNLWVTMYGGGRVIKVDGATGRKVQRLQISASALKTTSCCFGGPNMDELFVTSASDDVPVGDAGSLFKVTGLGVKGQLATTYDDLHFVQC